MNSRKRRNPEKKRAGDAELQAPRNPAGHPRRRLRVYIPLTALAIAIIALPLWGIPFWRMRLAEHSIQSWQLEEAKQRLADYPAWGPSAAKAYFLRARIDRLQGGYVNALEYLRAAQSGGFDSQAILRERTLLNVQNGQWSPETPEQLEAFLVQAPEDSPAIYEVFANAQFHAGDKKSAFAMLDRWSQQYPGDGRPLYWKGVMNAVEGDDESALEMHVESTRRSPSHFDSHLAQARIWWERSEFEQALKAYRTAFEIAPNRLEARIGLASTLWKLRRKPEAVALLEPVTRENPTLFPAGRMVAQYYTDQNQPEKVIAILEPMMNHFPEDASLNYMLGSAYHALDRPAESKAALKKFFLANQETDLMRSTLFKETSLAKQYDELMERASVYRRYDWKSSLKWLNLAAQSQPNNPQPHRLLSKHYQENGSIDEAVRQQNLAESLSMLR